MANQDEIIKIADRYRFKSAVYVRIHNVKSKRQQIYNRYFGVIVLISTTTVGSTLFANYSKGNNVDYKLPTLILSAVAAILSALQTFLGFSENATKHKKASAEFGSINVKLVNFLLKYQVILEDKGTSKTLDEFTSIIGSFQKALSEAPTITDIEYNYYKKKEENDKYPNLPDSIIDRTSYRNERT